MICDNCGNEHDGSYGSGRFCCKECAHSYITKFDNKQELKEAKCTKCGKSIYINKRASIYNCKCNDCTLNAKTIKKLKIQKYNRYIKCPICGQNHLMYMSCNNDFCKNHNRQQFRSLIKYFGFDKTKLGTNEVENEFNKVRENLYDLYWNKHLSSIEICKRFNYPNVGNLTGKIFHYLNIPSKNSKQSVLENMNHRNFIPQNNAKSYGNEQWYTTWNNKEVFLRSSYELNYAKELDAHQIDYDVECLRIKYWDSQKQKYRCAIPDFYIPSQNLIVEIKSEYTLDKQNMKDKFKAYKELGYNIKLICDYKELEI